MPDASGGTGEQGKARRRSRLPWPRPWRGRLGAGAPKRTDLQGLRSGLRRGGCGPQARDRAARGRRGPPCVRCPERPDDGCRGCAARARSRHHGRRQTHRHERQPLAAGTGRGWRRRAPSPPAGLVDRPERPLGADRPRAAHLACGRVRGSAAAARAPRTGHAAARDRRLRVRDRLRRPLRAGEGVVRRPAPAAGHQPPDGDRGRGRDRHRRMVRGRDGRFSLRLVAHARELEHRQGTPRDLGAARPDAADRARAVGHRRGAGDRGGRSAGRHALHRPAGRAHRARRPRRRRDERGRPGADHRRERAGRQGAGRRGVRRHHQRRRRARGREHQGRRGYDARPHHAHGRGGAQPARPGRAVGREVRPRLHARGDRARARDLRACRRCCSARRGATGSTGRSSSW